MTKRKFDYSDLVIVGAWNKSIINPIWLTEQFPILIKNSEDIISELKIGASNIFRYTVDDVSIEIGNEKLVFITKNDIRKKLLFISEMSSAIFEKLPHTPIMAVGHNFIYELKKREVIINKKLFDNSTNKKIFQKINPEDPIEQKIQFSYAFTNHLLNLSLNNKKDGANISFNYHYPVDSPKKVKNAISEFMDNYNDSKIQFSKLVNGK